jgi:thioredoxin reductase
VTEDEVTENFDCVVIGAGPAGLSATLNLVRARHRTLTVDTGRPRNAATLISHGFMTRDGISPRELRQLAVGELTAYPESQMRERSTVAAVRRRPTGDFDVVIAGRGAIPDETVTTPVVVVATGLREELPAIPSLRAFYGMSIFSCVACDGYAYTGQPLALIGETDDLVRRALLIYRWSSDLVVCTNGAAVISADEEAILASKAIVVDRRQIEDLEGEKGAVTAIHFADGGVRPISGGFVRPRWHLGADFLEGLDLDVTTEGLLVADPDGRTTVPGLYVAGDAAAPGPQQLIVAAGRGARVAAVITHDGLGVVTSH